MTKKRTRRDFLGDVGRGMLVAGVGSSLAFDLGLAPLAWAGGAEEGDLEFGALEPLVDRLESRPLEALQPFLAESLKEGRSLQDLVAAGALANARAFGGQDYEGYHVMMALVPAFELAGQLPANEQALPIFKVLYRNSARMHRAGRVGRPTLKAIEPGAVSVADARQNLRRWTRSGELVRSEAALARLVEDDVAGAYGALQPLVHDDIEVHRVVLAWRSWDMLRLTGPEHAETLLRQNVRFCIKDERPDRAGEIRRLLPELLESCRLTERSLGSRTGDDTWLSELRDVIFSGRRADAARAVTAALAEGYSPESVGEAMSLAATELLLHDPGRRDPGSFGRGKGSVHGASVGVHASDSANAWRNIARVSNDRNRAASLIVGAYHTAGQRRKDSRPFPFESRVTDEDLTRDAAALASELNRAVKAKDQARAAAVAHVWGQRGLSEEPIFRCLLGFAVSEDGALHAEKYYRTVQGEFATTRPSFRWRYLVALARVTASEYGKPAPGRAQARELLGV